MNLGVIGAGYVGLTTGICLSTLGHKIFIYDKLENKIQKIKEKVMPFFEEGLQELLEKTISSENLKATNYIDELTTNTDGCFICVGTPSLENNSIDLSHILNATQLIAESINKNSKKNYVIIIRSTVIPTTTRKKILPLIKEVLGEQLFGLCVMPEFLREGQALTDFMNPDKIVIGSFDDYSQNFAEKIFEKFKTEANIITTNPETAEMIKYTNNAFFSTLISFSNEIANISEKITNVDSFEVLTALISDKRITSKFNKEKIIPELDKYLIPGCGFGGSCFPKDVKAILEYAESNKVKTPLLKAVLEINSERPNRIISLAESILHTLKGKRISVLGLTFKPNTDDIRSSPSLAAISLLKNKGAKIFGYDPMLSKNPNHENTIVDITLSNNIEECLENSDLAILFTKWPEFRSLDGKFLKKHMKNPVIIDGRGFLDQTKFEKNTYYKIGFVK